jgi:hypothetical protein
VNEDELNGALDAAAAADEQGWLDDPELGAEAVFQHVGAGVLLGDGLFRSGEGPQLQRMGRNLLTEAEHATALRSARDLMQRAQHDPLEDADAIARSGGDGPGVQYLRDNSDDLLSSLSTRQAEAAQVLLDTYGELGRLRPDPKQLERSIPEKRIEQAQWLGHARVRVGNALDAVPDSIAAPLREQLAELGDGGKPAQWFERATDLSDALTRTRAKAARMAKAAEGVDAGAHQEALDAAQRVLRAGLGDATLWGSAAATETERASGYARRVDDHLGAFESHFAERINGKTRIDPGKFRALLQGNDPEAAAALAGTLEAARTTAGTAARFGRGGEARRILESLDALEATGAQARAVQSALRGGAPVDRSAAEAAALEALGGASDETPADARAGVFRAVRGFLASSREDSKRAASELLQPRGLGSRGSPAALQIAAPGAPSVTLRNFDAVRDHLEKLTQDPRYFAEAVGSSFGSMPQVAPEVFQAISAQTAKAATYLVATAPGGTSGGPFAGRVPVSQDELWEWNQRLQAVSDPQFVRRELRAGSLSTPSIEAYQFVSPRKFQALQLDVFSTLRQLHEDGVPVPVNAREQLDVLLDLDGGGEPALTWQVQERAEAGEARHRQRLQMPKKGEPSGAMQSDALNTLSNGAAAQRT